MTVANIFMFEFDEAAELEKWVAWYKDRGPFPETEFNCVVQTGETSGMGIATYPTEEARQLADKLRTETAQNSGFAVREIIPLSGTVRIQYRDGKFID